MHYVPYILYLFLIAFYRIILADLFSFGRVEIFLAALLIILVALNKDALTSLWFGFCAGLVYDALNPDYLGVHMLILCLMGVAASRLKDRFNLEAIRSRLLLLTVGLLVYAVPNAIIYQRPGSGELLSLLVQGIIPSVVYTTLLGWLFFMVQTGRISYKKLKKIF